MTEWLKNAVDDQNENYNWEQFLILKSSLDNEPNTAIADGQHMALPIIRSFFHELPEPFFPTFSTRNLSNSLKCTYYSIGKLKLKDLGYFSVKIKHGLDHSKNY